MEQREICSAYVFVSADPVKNRKPTTCKRPERLLLIPTVMSQGVWVSRVGADIDAIVRARYFPRPNQSRVIGEERAFAGYHSLHEQGRLGFAGSESLNLVEMAMVVKNIGKDDGVPSREGHLQCFTGSVFKCLAREITEQGGREVEERLRDLSIRN